MVACEGDLGKTGRGSKWSDNRIKKNKENKEVDEDVETGDEKVEDADNEIKGDEVVKADVVEWEAWRWMRKYVRRLHGPVSH